MNETSSTSTGRGAFSELQEALSGLFENIVGRSPGFGLERRYPRSELRVEDDGYRVFADLPGMQRDDIDVSVSGHTLTISGRWPELEVPDNSETVRRERPRGKFARAVQLPDDIDPMSVVAHFRDGVLEVRLGKPSAARGRSIKVEATQEEPEQGGQKRKKAVKADKEASNH